MITIAILELRSHNMNDMIHSRNMLTKFDIFSNLRYNIIMKIDNYLLCHFALEGDITLLLKAWQVNKVNINEVYNGKRNRNKDHKCGSESYSY